MRERRLTKVVGWKGAIGPRRPRRAVVLGAAVLAVAGLAGQVVGLPAAHARIAPAPVAERQPNILIIVADDLGFGDVGFNGASVPTPNIDRIAQMGMVLDHFYVSALCSPSRAGLLTGRYPNRFGIMGDTITPGSDFGLDPKEETIAQVLARAGYARRSFLGKWHLGHRSAAFHPMNFGFTSFYGHYNGAIDYFTHKRESVVDWHRDRSPSADQGYSTDLLSDEAVRIIKTPSPGGKPWMMWLAYNAPHGPFQATEQDLKAVGFDPTKPRYGGPTGDGGPEGPDYGQRGHGNTRRQTALAMIHGLDRGIGRVLDTLEATGQLNNTIIFFTSDNGGPGTDHAADPPSSTAPLRGWKFQHYEGGVRVAAAMAWPARLKPRARADVGPISYVDVLPTLAHLAHATSNRQLDGQDMSAALLSERKLKGDRVLFMGEDYRIAPAYGERGPGGRDFLRGRAASAMIGRWKLVGAELYDVEADPTEKHDVAAQHPDVVARIMKRAKAFEALRKISRDRLNATHLPPLPLWELPKR
nr:sulfatase-like hydrolase/transferase [Sphingomonas sp.]